MQLRMKCLRPMCQHQWWSRKLERRIHKKGRPQKCPFCQSPNVSVIGYKN